MTHAAAHHSVKVFSRAKGQSATAAAAYRLAVVIADERTGTTHDYTAKKRGVEYTAHVGWSDDDPGGLWNAAEAAEKRKNSAVARETTVALPAELDPAERARLARGYALWLRDQYGVAASVAVHKPDRKGDERNYHAHILYTTRVVDDQGAFGAKTRVLDAKETGGTEVERMRQEWAKRCNKMLEKKGVQKRVDPRSYKRRADEDGGPVLPSVPHLGKDATALIRKRREIAKRTGRPQLGVLGPLRVETDAQLIKLQQVVLKRAHHAVIVAVRAATEAQWAADYADAATATAPDDRSAVPASATQGPTHDAGRRAEGIRQALAPSTPNQPPEATQQPPGRLVIEEWADDPADPTQPPRGRGIGRERSR